VLPHKCDYWRIAIARGEVRVADPRGLLTLAGAARARRRRLTDALLAEHAAGGAVRRGGQGYTFDTAMALSGLLTQMPSANAWATTGSGTTGSGTTGVDNGKTTRAALDWASLLITAAERADPSAGSAHADRPVAGTRWSMAFGAHQAKVCGALIEAGRVLGPLPGLDDAITAFAAAALDVQSDDGRFRIHAASPMTYVHGHCYAVEGLLMRDAAGRGETLPEVVAGAAWLAAVQQADGSLPAWHDGRAGSGPPRADATAQALRIWTLVDPDRFAGAAARAQAFLAGLWTSPRGLRYEPGSGDLNAWATIFAA
jgi:hypothetical protein